MGFPVAGNLGSETGNDINLHLLQAVDAGRLEVLRPELLYPTVIPPESINNSTQPGMKDYSKVFGDQSGIAAWRGQGSNIVPIVSTRLDLTNVPIFAGGIGNVLDVRDIRQGKIIAARGFDEDPIVRTAQVMRVATEYFIERLFFFGDSIYDSLAAEMYPGLINHPIIPQSTVPVGAALGTEWGTKDAEEILADISNAITNLWTSTNSVHMATDIYIPMAQFGLISSKKAGVRANDEVIINFISEQNMVMQLTGRKINIKPIRYLEGAGVGATDRMLVVDKQKDNYMISNPIDFAMLPVTLNKYLWEYAAEYEISPLHLPRPHFAAYYDGI